MIIYRVDNLGVCSAAADAGPDVIDNSGLKINKQSTSHQSGLGRIPRQNGECSPCECSVLICRVGPEVRLLNYPVPARSITAGFSC